MSEKIEKEISAKFIEQKCSTCSQGVYRQTGNIEKNSSPVQINHRCSHCGHVCSFTVGYPLVEYKGKRFMLADILAKLGNMPKPDL